MSRYYVTAKIAQLDLGATVEAENQYMATIKFVDEYKHKLRCDNEKITVLEVEDTQ